VLSSTGGTLDGPFGFQPNGGKVFPPHAPVWLPHTSSPPHVTSSSSGQPHGALHYNPSPPVQNQPHRAPRPPAYSNQSPFPESASPHSMPLWAICPRSLRPPAPSATGFQPQVQSGGTAARIGNGKARYSGDSYYLSTSLPQPPPQAALPQLQYAL
jgi:hypothetical protein